MRLFRCMLLLFALIPIAPSVINSQSRTILVIAVPDWWEGQFDDAIFDDFEAQHTGVDVVVNFVVGEDVYFGPPHVNFDNHMNDAIDYAAKGDVLYTGSYQMSVEATRAGVYLDMSPLAATDPDLHVEDFYPALWNSFQWDGGLWAIPVGSSLIVNVYDKIAFDDANIAYPDVNWTLTNYADSISDLATYKASGMVEVPGLHTYHAPTLFYSLLNRGIYDVTTMPESANLIRPDIIELLTTWTDLIKANVANPFALRDFDDYDVPLHIEETFRITSRYQKENTEWHASLLPNGFAGLRTDALAISSGTNNPELSYELIMYLTQQPDLVNFYNFDVNARRSMSDVENENNALVFGERPPELQVLLDEAILAAIPTAEMRFYGYLDTTIQKVLNEGKSVDDALIEAQQLLNINLTKASEISQELTIVVQSPAATPVLDADEIVLSFGMNTFVSPLPNREDWDRVVQEFIASDLEVGQINLSFDLGNTADDDCFYRQFNNLRGLMNEDLLPIEPFLNADPYFDRNDIASAVLTQVSFDNQIWGMPLSVTPVVLWLNETSFNRAGVPLPDTQWTINEFVDALQQLDTLSDDPPFAPRVYGSNYVLNLIAAFGGFPIDPNQPAAVPDLISEQNMNAIRQVLDLARSGWIDYNTLENNIGFFGSGENTGNLPIYDATLSSLDYRFQQRRDGVTDTFYAALYPSGTQYTPISVEVGAGYINANTPYAEACYRWLSFLADNPTLFDGMPARRSQLATTQMQGEDLYQLYTTIDNQISQPNTVILPFIITGPEAYRYQQWMFRAFDRYVLDDVSLDIALAEAQQIINDYANCIEPIPALDRSGLTQESINNYVAQFNECAFAVDPTLGNS